MKNSKLPTGVKKAEFFRGPSYRDGDEILGSYCKACKKKPRCRMRKTLKHAMGENFPYWSPSFLPVKVELGGDLDLKPDVRVMCTRYNHREDQLMLPGFERSSEDCIDMLLEVIEREKRPKSFIYFLKT